MPLSPEERLKLQAVIKQRQQAGTPTAQPSFLPPEIESALQTVQGTPQQVRIGSRGASIIPGVPAAQNQEKMRAELLKTALQERLKQSTKNEKPASTESERKATRVAEAAMVPLQQIRALLQVDEGTNTVRNRAPITPDIPGFKGRATPWMNKYGKQLRDNLNQSWDLLAMLRTGVAGEAAQKESLMAQSNIGETDDAETIIRRLKALETEIEAFRVGDYKSPLDSSPDGAGAVGSLNKGAGREMVDAKGRRARVFDDGSYELIR